ncbi:universal stress protein [Rhodocyclus purpureus]|uniref:universal stress protein n=1 Tax=Rhodocyclus purpureus TaxID=1067 RepID=UPI001911439E|nr:universal stress protein [Rhodocyclus purpureus]MBK5913975.1 sulfate transporter [Rhodocyclus purpureus]
MFRHLLVPTDGSELSRATVQRAVLFASEIGARITFFHAEPRHTVSFWGNEGITDPGTREASIRRDDQRATSILAAASAEAVAAGVEASAIAGKSDSPFEAIIATSQSQGCDLIFMASHGRRGIAGLLLGSETHKVLTHSKIPVLVVR